MVYIDLPTQPLGSERVRNFKRHSNRPCWLILSSLDCIHVGDPKEEVCAGKGDRHQREDDLGDQDGPLHLGQLPAEERDWGAEFHLSWICSGLSKAKAIFFGGCISDSFMPLFFSSTISDIFITWSFGRLFFLSPLSICLMLPWWFTTMFSSEMVLRCSM